MSVDFNTKTVNIYIYIYIYKKKILLYFFIGMRLSFYPGMGDVTVVVWLLVLPKK